MDTRGPLPPPPPTRTRAHVPRIGRAVPSAAGWLAIAGSSLLLVASIVVVAGRWQQIGPEVRLAGLTAAVSLVFFLAERLRRSFPTTASAMATLAACLVAPGGIAVAATLGAGWPTCLTVGGVLSLAACVAQSRRWQLDALRAASVVAFGVAAFGLAGLTGLPANVIAAGGAAAALALAAPRRALALAATVGISPLLALLAELRIGDGTLAIVGLSGPALVWSAPLACTIAGAVIAVLADRRDNAPLAVAALAVVVSGIITAFTAGGAITAWWWALAPVALLVAEVAAAARDDRVWRRLGRSVAPPLALALGVVALTLPFQVLGASQIARSGGFFDRTTWLAALLDNAGLDASFALPAAMAAIAMTATAWGSARRSGDRDVPWRPLALTASNAALFAAAAFAGLPWWIAAVVSLIALAGTLAAVPWGTSDAFAAAPLAWVLLALVLEPPVLAVAMCVLTAVALVWLFAISFDTRADHGVRLIGGAIIVALIAAGLVADRSNDALGFDVGLIALLVVIAAGVGMRPDRRTGPLVAASALSLVSLGEMSTTWSVAALLATLGLAFTAASRRADALLASIAASLYVGAAGATAAAAGLEPAQLTALAMVATVALAGASFVDRRLGALRAASVVAAVLSVAAASTSDPVLVSLAVAVAGATTGLLGGVHLGREAGLPGAALTAGGIISLWWTTGTNDWVIAAVEPYGATGSDVAIGAAVVVLLAAGSLARSLLRDRADISSWLAYSPALGMAATWLVATQLETGTEWATFGALAFGVVALAIGAVRRLGAPLVFGTGMVAATVVVSAGPRLADAPTWLWIASTGAGLLGLAALVERSERPLLPRPGAEQASLLETFCGSFK